MTEEDRDKIKYNEHRFDCLWYINNKDTFKPQKLKPDESAQDYYVDQAYHNISFGDRTVTSFFTPHGINEIDTWFSKQIYGESEFTKEELTKMIRRNPHLHNIIKTNLLENLNNKI